MRHRVLSNHAEIIEIIKRCQICHVAMVDPEGKPYLVPMNFGFANDIIYLHSARKGKKIECLKNNPSVCINFTTDHKLLFQHEDVACSYSMKYSSVLCYGRVEFIEDAELKRNAFDVVMKQYTNGKFTYNPPSIREVNCWIVKVQRFDGRIHRH
ncbi:MAG: pyridoxamine 5'-phosphate oxidase family protein [Bacteroidales bacterium]|nr:pyridoxamine 5'-phosphate oxidase family protein [Bacteroidales bacterium]